VTATIARPRPLSLRQLFERPGEWPTHRRMQVEREIAAAPTREDLFDLMRLRPALGTGISFALVPAVDQPAAWWGPDTYWQYLDEASRTRNSIPVGEILTLHAISAGQSWVMIGRAPNLQFPFPPGADVRLRAEFTTWGDRRGGRFIVSWRPPGRRRRS
jgi:hypothetical protein